MKLEVITTIRTLIDLDTFETDHSVDVDGTGAEGLPKDLILASVIGGCKSTIGAMEGQMRPRLKSAKEISDDEY